MKYLDFKNKYRKLPFFLSSSFVGLGEPIATLRKQLNDWCQKKLVIQLRRGMYTINDADRSTPADRTIISNALVAPSYISLEYALSFYGFIPERVEVLTAITSQKTQQFSNNLGTFRFCHVPLGAFTGFIEEKTMSGLSFFIATPEKAVVDYLYKQLSIINPQDRDVFEHSFRFQNLEPLKIERLQYYGDMFHSKKLNRIIEMLIQFIAEQGFETI